jgi:bile acid:Na+ symporter, BASS family
MPPQAAIRARNTMSQGLPLLSRLLAAIGRRGEFAFALSIFLGLALPQLAEAARPFLVITVFVFTMLTYARVDLEDLKDTLARPGRLALILIYAIVAPPLVLLAILAIVPSSLISEALMLGLVLYVAAPVLNGSPAFAMLLGFRNGLILTILFVQMIVTPLVSPPLASWMMGHELPISGWSLALRLGVMVFGGTLGALLIRRLVGPHRLKARAHELNGLNVVLYFLFAIAAMDGVIEATRADPSRTFIFLGIAFALSAVMFAASLAVTRPLGRNDSFTLSIGVGLRNIGLLAAAFGPSLPKEAFLYFSLSQFPTYLAPILMAPLARRFAARD